MLNPEDSFCMKVIFQFFFNLLLRECVVPVFCKQTTRCDHQRAFAITFDTATFKDKVKVVPVFSLDAKSMVAVSQIG